MMRSTDSTLTKQTIGRVLVQAPGSNMRSRWTDFLTTNGEKFLDGVEEGES
jgi:hypothetical protein